MHFWIFMHNFALLCIFWLFLHHLGMLGGSDRKVDENKWNFLPMLPPPQFAFLHLYAYFCIFMHNFALLCIFWLFLHHLGMLCWWKQRTFLAHLTYTEIFLMHNFAFLCLLGYFLHNLCIPFKKYISTFWLLLKGTLWASFHTAFSMEHNSCDHDSLMTYEIV